MLRTSHPTETTRSGKSQNVVHSHVVTLPTNTNQVPKSLLLARTKKKFTKFKIHWKDRVSARMTKTDKGAWTGTARDESWTKNPEYTNPNRRPTKVSTMDSPVRTVERHLAEVGKRALHKGLFSCSDDIVQTVPGVRITGEQGQIWSCNPMYREDHFCSMYAPPAPSSSTSSSSDDSASVEEGKHCAPERRRNLAPLSSWSYGEDSLSLDDETDSDLDDDEEDENEINKIGEDFMPFGLTYQVHLEEEDLREGSVGDENENKSYEVSTIDTPRTIVDTPSEAGTRSAFSEFGVQTEDSWTREEEEVEDNEFVRKRTMGRTVGGDEGLEFLCASAAELSDLRGIQDQIEHKDQEILELFQGLSNEFAGCSTGALEEVRMLRELVEQKELETSQLYSQISQEMHSAMQPPVQQALSETTIRNGYGVDFAVKERNVGGAAVEEDFWDYEGTSPGGMLCPSARNPPPQGASCTLPRPISRAEVPCPNPSPPGLTKFMSGSSYFEVELDNAVSVTYGELNNRVQELEQDLRKKESEIAERDQVIQRLKMRKQDNSWEEAACCKVENERSTAVGKATTTTFGHSRKDSYCFSPRDEFSLQDVDNSCDLWGQGNPPWDSNRGNEVELCERKKLWSDALTPGYKMFDKVDKFEVDFPPIILKKTPALM
ncbi:hypothetical protein BSKO_08317 [Bryopsis sp. KO-2023]|nr:hypothetical protein BSKO_08317 [Bryopsis sp. KO-2023]